MLFSSVCCALTWREGPLEQPQLQSWNPKCHNLSRRAASSMASAPVQAKAAAEGQG